MGKTGSQRFNRADRKKILIIGKHSYIGTNFQKYLSLVHSDWIVESVGASDGEWENISFLGYHCILFTAAIVHKKEKGMSYDIYKKINCDFPVQVAKKAKKAGVEQFIFLSSMAVFGSRAEKITFQTIPEPDSFYGRSKYEAEQKLQKLQDANFHLAILRPPIVYGEGCPGNYGRLKKLARWTFLFPDTKNRRSMIEIGQLCKELCHIVEKNSSGIFHVQDETYVNTAQMVRQMRTELGKKTWLISWMNWILVPLAKRVGLLRKIFGSLWYEKE